MPIHNDGSRRYHSRDILGKVELSFEDSRNVFWFGLLFQQEIVALRENRAVSGSLNVLMQLSISELQISFVLKHHHYLNHHSN